MEYGYAFLRASGPRGENRSIAEMSMAELRGYLCAKTLGNPKACITCNGIKNCQVGSRAIALLSQEAREKANGQEDRREPAKNAAETTRTQEDKDAFQEACESGNARRWLLERGYSDAGAQEKLTYWVKHYPGIVRTYGRKRILQKTKKVTITSVTETKAPERIRQEPPEEQPAAEPTEIKPKRSWAPEKLDKLRKAREEEARRRCAEAIAAGNPVDFLVEQGKTRNAARLAVSRWRQKFPDLFETQTETQTSGTPESTEDKATANEDDEISLAEFLAGFETAEDFRKGPATEENPNGTLARLMQDEANLLEQVTEYRTENEPLGGHHAEGKKSSHPRHFDRNNSDDRQGDGGRRMDHVPTGQLREHSGNTRQGRPGDRAPSTRGRCADGDPKKRLHTHRRILHRDRRGMGGQRIHSRQRTADRNGQSLGRRRGTGCMQKIDRRRQEEMAQERTGTDPLRKQRSLERHKRRIRPDGIHTGGEVNGP